MHKKLLILVNNLNNFCFDGGGNNYVTVSNYDTRLVKDIKIN